MAGLPLLTDNHVRQPIIKALRARGWDVVRAVDVLGERNDDDELLAWAAANGRVFVTSDDGIHAAAHRWLREGRAFRMIYWWAEHRRRMSDGEVVQALERDGDVTRAACPPGAQSGSTGGPTPARCPTAGSGRSTPSRGPSAIA